MPLAPNTNILIQFFSTDNVILQMIDQLIDQHVMREMLS